MKNPNPKRERELAAIAKAQIERERRSVGDAYVNSWAMWRPLNPCCATHVTVAWSSTDA
jgi:hypothetical protein